MILQPGNVELTKVHYYDKTRWSQNMSISTISREMCQNNFNKNMLVKKNVFGQKWVLKINEKVSNKDPKKRKRRKLLIFICVSVFVSIIVAMFFGVAFSLDFNIFRTGNKNVPDRNQIVVNSYNKSKLTIVKEIPVSVKENRNTSAARNNNAKSNESETISTISHQDSNITKRFPYCSNCTIKEICFKTSEIDRPKCVLPANENDPTGCGGLCKINIEFCKNLDRDFHVYQCLNLKNRLKCPEETFNCENMCIPLKKRCDGRIDCANMSDEKDCECNLETHFQCGNRTSCLGRNKYCDGKVDCWDKSDEIRCLNKDDFSNTFCEENHIPCLNGQCIPKDKMCDNVFDCSDRTDEPLWCQQLKP